MRPPLNAGENAAAPADGAKNRIASMRPPLNAGENRGIVCRQLLESGASMRPPLNAGENGAARHVCQSPPRRFNEAPAERGGKPASALVADHTFAKLQ